MPIPLLIPLAIGVAGAVGKMVGRGKANRKMNELLSQDPQYKANPLAAERYSLAKTLLNARMPGSVQAERNIYKSGANATSSASRAATDSSQLLATAGEIQGNQNEAFTGLGMQEANDYQRRYGNYANAQDQQINEQDKVYSDQLRRYNDRFDVEGAKNENRQNTWGDISNLGFGLANFGAAGGFQGMFGGGGNGRFDTPLYRQGGVSQSYGGVPAPNIGIGNRRTPNFG